MLGIPDGIIGMKINSFKYDSGDIELIGDDKVVHLTAYGDCCSSSWFEHVDDLGAFPGTILDIDEDGSTPYDVDDTGHEDLKVYFLTIKTDKGRFTVDMRNSSNGYYGGSFNWSVEAK